MKAEDLSEDQQVKGEAHMTARYSMAAVVAYWKSNCGSAWALRYYESFLIKNAAYLHVQEIVELCQAFRWNRTHHRDHLRNML